MINDAMLGGVLNRNKIKNIYAKVDTNHNYITFPEPSSVPANFKYTLL